MMQHQAEQELQKAVAEHRAAETRVAEAEKEVEEASKLLAEMDPDQDPKAFAKLIQTRDVAWGRLDALSLRAEAKAQARATAEAAAREAKDRALREELAGLWAKLRADEAKVTTDIRYYLQEIADRLGQHQDLARQINALEVQLHGAPRFTGKPSMWTELHCKDAVPNLAALAGVFDRLRLGETMRRWDEDERKGAEARARAQAEAQKAPPALVHLEPMPTLADTNPDPDYNPFNEA